MARMTLTEKELAALSTTYNDIQDTIKALEIQKATIKQRIFEHLDATVGKEIAGEIECGDGYKFAREVRKSKSLNEVRLQDMIPGDIWKKVTKAERHIDETKLKKAVADGVVDKEIIKECIDEKKSYALLYRPVKIESE